MVYIERKWGLIDRTSDTVEAPVAKPSSLEPVRANLIKKGMIFSPAYGEIAFTIPLFDEFMRWAISEPGALLAEQHEVWFTGT